MTSNRNTKWDEDLQEPKKSISDKDKQAMAVYLGAGLNLGKRRIELIEELMDKYGRSSRQIERYIAEHSPTEEQFYGEGVVNTVVEEPSVTVSAIELAKFEHWKELASMADDIVISWEAYNLGHPFGGYRGYVVDEEQMDKLKSAMLRSLLLHMKQEFNEFEKINSWQDLLKIDANQDLIVKLALIAKRVRFKGTCPFCEE
jgi:coenzyme F420-reducing hydrogenase alpha subunit